MFRTPPNTSDRGEDTPPGEGVGYPIEDVWNANRFEFALQVVDSSAIRYSSKVSLKRRPDSRRRRMAKSGEPHNSRIQQTWRLGTGFLCRIGDDRSRRRANRSQMARPRLEQIRDPHGEEVSLPPQWMQTVRGTQPGAVRATLLARHRGPARHVTTIAASFWSCTVRLPTSPASRTSMANEVDASYERPDATDAAASVWTICSVTDSMEAAAANGVGALDVVGWEWETRAWTQCGEAGTSCRTPCRYTPLPHSA